MGNTLEKTTSPEELTAGEEPTVSRPIVVSSTWTEWL
jgi:hypothetical protein